MSWLIRILWIVVLGVLLVAFYPEDPGEVLIRLHGIGQIKTTPLVLIAVVVFAVFLVMTVFQLLGWFFALPRNLSQRWRENRMLRADERLLTGWTWLSSGGYAEALKLAKQTYQSKISTTEAALLAARAEMKMDRPEEAALWLQRVEDKAPRHQLNKDLMQAKLHIHRQQHTEALKVIDALEYHSGFNSVLGRLRIQAYQQSKQWGLMIKLNQSLFKKGLSPQSDFQLWRRQARLGEWQEMNQGENPFESITTKFPTWWKKLEVEEQQDHKLLLVVTNQLNQLLAAAQQEPMNKAQAQLQSVAMDWMEKMLSTLMGKPINQRGLASVMNTMLQRYSEWVPNASLDQAIKKCQDWLNTAKENAALLRTTAKLCARRELWGNAIRYYEAALSFEPDNQSQLQLAQIYRHIGQPEKAEKWQAQLLLGLQPKKL